MQSTIKALEELRDHWHSIGCPPTAQIGRKANVTSATAYRYLNNITKGGSAEIIRALAIAMDREDIAKSLGYSGFPQGNPEDYYNEQLKLRDEADQQRAAEENARHKQELEVIMRDHRIERENWHEQRNAYCKEIERLSASFDSLAKIQHREKWIAYALLFAAVVALLLK